MSETASHYRYKSLGSFCFEAFKHFLYPNAVTRTTSYGFAVSVRVFNEENCLAYYVFNTGARLIICTKTYRCMNNRKIVFIRLTFESPLTVDGHLSTMTTFVIPGC